jgi:hypothetical protein
VGHLYIRSGEQGNVHRETEMEYSGENWNKLVEVDERSLKTNLRHHGDT